MDFGLSDEQLQIQRTARELLSVRARPERLRELAGERRSDEKLWAELGELGWLGIAIPEEHGGQGLGQVELSILCEELGRTLAPVPFLPTVMASALISHCGSQGQCERWLPQLSTGAAVGALGVAVDGCADLVLGAPQARIFVLVEDDRAKVLERDEVHVEELDAIDPTRSAASVSAPQEAGEPLERTPSAGLDRALVCVASELVGLCEQALEMTVAYVKERKQFGVPVGAYQAVSHRCAQMLLDTEQARSAAAFAAWCADASPQRLAEAAAMAKASASEAGLEVSASAIQAHGGIGFTWECDVHWYYKRAQLDSALLGSAKRHRARLAAILADRAGVAATEVT